MKIKYLVSLVLSSLSFTTCIAQSLAPEKANAKFKVNAVVPLQAYAFNIKDVQLLSGSPFKNAMDKDAAYLLTIEPNRLLHRFYANAGLPTKGAVYGGWENGGLSGHTMGHYLSACAMMYVSTGNNEFKTRVDYLVDELEKCQIARKTGYIGAIPKEDSIFGRVAKGDIKTSGFDMNGGWSPWYTVHKVMSGLMDAYLYADNDKALKLVIGMADWTYLTVNHLPDSLRLKMLRCEWGGMNDILANIYAVTGNKKYLDLSYQFYDDFVMKPLSEKIDPMPGKHSNTNVPKAIGSATQYELTGNESDKTIASFFWQTIVNHHSYVIGGNSSYEYCGDADKLNDRLSDNTCETCNTYNMLKLTRHLICWQPKSEYSDYYERALYNHILSSQNPNNGMMCYFVPLRMGTQKQFSDSFNTFTCCVGTGMENHSKYSEGIYYHSGDEKNLYVNLFIASKLNWKEKGIQLSQQTNYPESDNTTVTVQTRTSQTFTMLIRHPWWAKQGVHIKVNGKALSTTKNADGYITVNRKWHNNDKMEIEFPMSIYTESIPDNKDRIAILYGPLVLAGQLGEAMPDPVYGIPVLLTDDRNASNWIKPVTNKPLEFKMQQVGEPFDATLIPFYQTVSQHYSVYWDYFSQAGWAAKKDNYEVEKKRMKEIEMNSIDYFRIGEMQPERDHNLKSSERSYVSDALGINGREARVNNYFSFDMKIDTTVNNSLLFVYIGDDRNRKFDILIDGKLFKTEDWKGGEGNKFYNIEYPIPDELLKNKTKINVRIEANYTSTAGRIFGCRIVKH